MLQGKRKTSHFSFFFCSLCLRKHFSQLLSTTGSKFIFVVHVEVLTWQQRKRTHTKNLFKLIYRQVVLWQAENLMLLLKSYSSELVIIQVEALLQGTHSDSRAWSQAIFVRWAVQNSNKDFTASEQQDK